MELILEFFTNDRYLLLKMLYDNQVKVKDDFYIPLSQQEMADILHFSKLKTNKMLNELIDIGCIIIYQNKRGKYALTEKAIELIQLIQKTKV